MTAGSPIDVSVVIGFRNWGIRRIRLAIESVQRSFGTASGEVIISDYGSLDSVENEELARELGCTYVYTEDTGVWSRSRALNAGFALARGELLVSTDADMIFSPQALETVIELFHSDSRAAFFLQCRDLPQGMDDEWVEAHPEAWAEMEQLSRLRPRWGMGGMMAISREGFGEIRGFDERFHTYGAEDLDFAQRARRAGFKTVWVNDPNVRMYHMWHPPTRKAVDKTVEGRSAVIANREIVFKDKSFVRNYMRWEHRPDWVPPLVTVAICTHNREDLIGETILSVLAQTMQDFEILVIDDGGSDNTRNVVSAFEDPRIRYIWQEQGGISSARNHAARESRGLYTAVLDDDDLMHPRRLELHLENLMPGLAGNVGSFINFDDVSGEMALNVSKIPTIESAMEKGTAPGHSTWMVRTDVLRRFGYDETLTSGVDNNLMLRMLRAGARFGHIGEPVTLRRLHDRQVTVVDGDRQTGNAGSALRFLQAGLSKEDLAKISAESKERGEWPEIRPRSELLEEARVYLPDHLCKRDLIVSGGTQVELAECDWDGILTQLQIASVGQPETALQMSAIQGATYSDMVLARSMGLDFIVTPSEVNGPLKPNANQLSFVVKSASRLIERDGLESTFIMVQRDNEGTSSRLPWRVRVGTSSDVATTMNEDRRWMVFGKSYWEAVIEDN